MIQTFYTNLNYHALNLDNVNLLTKSNANAVCIYMELYI